MWGSEGPQFPLALAAPGGKLWGISLSIRRKLGAVVAPRGVKGAPTGVRHWGWGASGPREESRVLVGAPWEEREPVFSTVA